MPEDHPQPLDSLEIWDFQNPAKDIPDITGLWQRTARQMEQRNPGEEPVQSRRWVVPPDIDRATKKARPLLWNISATTDPIIFEGGGPGSVHAHESSIYYVGRNGCGEHQFTYTTQRVDTKTGIITAMQGILLRPTPHQLVTVVLGCDGNDSDLPRGFKELSKWTRVRQDAAP